MTRASFRDAVIWLPCAFFLKDVFATGVVLSNEPGITEANFRHYHLALLLGSVLFGGSGWTLLFNVCIAIFAGWLVSLWAKKVRRSMARAYSLKRRD